MHPTALTQIVASQQSRDRIATAARAIARTAGAAPERGGAAADAPIAIRRAGPVDAAALERLAVLDGRGRAFARVAAGWAAEPELTVLLAEAGDGPAAALVVSSGAVLADPFKDSGSLVRLLEARAAQLRPARTGAGARMHRSVLRALRA